MKQFELIQLTASACPPIPASTDPARPHCAGIQRGIRAYLATTRPDIVLIAMPRVALAEGPPDGPQLTSSMLQEMIRSLVADGAGRVVIVGPVPEWPMPLPQIFFRDRLIKRYGLESMAVPVRPKEYAAIDNNMRRAAVAAGATYVSLHDVMCSGNMCRTLVPDWDADVLMQFDQNHLTADASEWLAERTIGPALGMKSMPRTTVGLNEKLEFHDKAGGTKYLTSGWMPPEGWGTWTIDRKLPGLLALPVDRGTLPARVRIRFSAQLAPSFPTEQFRIQIGDDLPQPETVGLAEPVLERIFPITTETQRKIRRSGVLNLRFYAPEGRSSKSMGLNQDERVLGFGLREITLLP